MWSNFQVNNSLAQKKRLINLMRYSKEQLDISTRNPILQFITDFTVLYNYCLLFVSRIRDNKKNQQ